MEREKRETWRKGARSRNPSWSPGYHWARKTENWLFNGHWGCLFSMKYKPGKIRPKTPVNVDATGRAEKWALFNPVNFKFSKQLITHQFLCMPEYLVPLSGRDLFSKLHLQLYLRILSTWGPVNHESLPQATRTAPAANMRRNTGSRDPLRCSWKNRTFGKKSKIKSECHPAMINLTPELQHSPKEFLWRWMEK